MFEKLKPIRCKGLHACSDSNIKYRFEDKVYKINNDAFLLVANSHILGDDGVK